MGSASLLPNGKQQFLDQDGKPLASGAVYFYIPNTTTFKDTWQDAGQTIENTNPVLLNAAGEAIIYGSGDYRQVVKDAFGNTVWDEPTSAPVGIGAGTPGYAMIADEDGDAEWTPFKQAGTGAVNRTWLSKVQERCSILDFGADPTGTNDSSAALQAAVDAGFSSVFLPKGTYLFNSEINLTNFGTTRGLKIWGETSAIGTPNSVILGNSGAGKKVFDCTGSSFIGFEGLYITYGPTNPSTIGIYYARSTTNVECNFNWMTQCVVTMGTYSGTSYGIYNYAGEEFISLNNIINADVPLVFTASNFENITSSFATVVTGHQSCSAYFARGDQYSSNKYYAILLDSVNGSFFEQVFLYIQTGQTFPSAIWMRGTGETIRISGGCDNYKQAIANSGSYSSLDIFFQVTGNDNSVPLIELNNTEMSPVLKTSRVDIFSTAMVQSLCATTNQGSFALGTAVGNTFIVHPQQTIDFANGWSNVFICEDDNPTITLPSGQFSSLIISKEGSRAAGTAISSSIATPQTTVDVVTGDNAINANGHSFVRLSGATGAFDLGGIVDAQVIPNVIDGYRVTVFNLSSYQMTILNEDSSYSSANQILTLTGANVTLRSGPSCANFIYDSPLGKWILTSYN